ncbi:DUF418 domain-containing protein [Kineococcus esterisolvens]|uniref:DUF418 domain-containing protein n=1 Tax=unclassified Kineococcus TaxID=2621656 RepID=UPI003D7D6FB6
MHPTQPTHPTHPTHPAVRPRATALSERVPAPDLARGALLLFICLANVHHYLYARPAGVRGYPAAGAMSALDRVVTVLQTSLADARAFPMFSILVGYGTWQLVRRRLGTGTTPPEVRRLLRRRGAALLAVGALHGVLLFSGDIAATYGLLLVLLAGTLAAPRARGLVVLAVTGTVLAGAAGLTVALPGAEDAAALTSVTQETVPAALLTRAVEWGSATLLQPLLVFGAVAIGALAARRGLLDDPARHRRTLLAVGAGGVALSAAGGLPLGLLAAGAWETGTTGTLLAGGLHALTGYAGGAGYAALAGFVVVSASRRGGFGAPGRVLVALGRRSLSGYLGHSVVFAALLPASALGLGAELGVAQAALLAAGTWLLLLLGAAALERTGGRGPAEVLLRRLTYGRPR